MDWKNAKRKRRARGTKYWCQQYYLKFLLFVVNSKVWYKIPFFPWQVHPINYDVYLSYNTKDKSLADTVKKLLTDKSKQIRIYSEHQNINPDESWQEEIYQVGTQSLFHFLHLTEVRPLQMSSCEQVTFFSWLSIPDT